MLLFNMQVRMQTAKKIQENDALKMVNNILDEKGNKFNLMFTFAYSFKELQGEQYCNSENGEEQDCEIEFFCAFPFNRLHPAKFMEEVEAALNKELGNGASEVNGYETTAHDAFTTIRESHDRNARKVLMKLKKVLPDPSFKLLASMAPCESITLEEALAKAEKIYADSSLIEEIKRIYSEENEKRYIGQPVHYKITASNANSAQKIFELLVQCLYTNDRLLSHRVDILSDLNEGSFGDDQVENVIDAAEGCTLVIDTNEVDGGIPLAVMMGAPNRNEEKDMVKELKDMLIPNSEDTLFIVVDILDSVNHSKELAEALSKELVFVDIKERLQQSKEAAASLASLIQESELADYYDPSKLKLPEQKGGYSRSDIFNLYRRWRARTMKDYVYKAYSKVENETVAEVKPNEENAYQELMEMQGGLLDIKNIVKQIIATHKINVLRQRKGLADKQNVGLHFIFKGNPGTGKTTAARLLAKILAQHGVIKSDKLVECGRADLVGKYVGHTAQLVKETFRRASGGVLFIDEAYALCGEGKDFGHEAIDTIVQLMENDKDTAVIFAGYPEAMNEFLAMNAGLKSRIGYHIDFPDYSCEEMVSILEQMVEKQNYHLTEEANKKCLKILSKATQDKNFGNARYVRNMVDKAILAQAMRLTSLEQEDYSEEELLTLYPEDFVEPIVKAPAKAGQLGIKL